MSSAVGEDFIRVVIRVRPFNERERKAHSTCVVSMTEKTTTVIKDTTGASSSSGSPSPLTFGFDRCFWSHNPQDAHFASQRMVYSEVGEKMVDSMFRGINASLFAYGQTGSGKTFSLFGFEGEEAGVIPRFVESVFQRLERDTSGSSFKLEGSMLEIYQESIRDLFGNSGQALRIREHPKKGPYVEGLTWWPCSSLEEVSARLDQGFGVRTVAATEMNDASSRSHAIFQLRLTQMATTDLGNGSLRESEKTSVISLVDLAGSERFSTKTQTDRMTEGRAINKSLSALIGCIQALERACKSEGVHIPYRDSKLTQLLKESLGGNAKTAMLVTISPADVNVDETLSSLKYATLAKGIQTRAVVNEDEQIKLIRQLRAEVAELRRALQSSQRAGGVGPAFSMGDGIGSPAVASSAFASPSPGAFHQQQQQQQISMGSSPSSLSESSHFMSQQQQQQQQRLRAPSHKLPQLVSLNTEQEDGECLVYFLQPGSTLVCNADEAEASVLHDSSFDSVGSGDFTPGSEDDRIPLHGLDVAPKHAVIIHDVQKKTVEIMPIGSAPTYVNGEAITGRTLLQHRMRIAFGFEHIYRYHDPEAAAVSRKQREQYNKLHPDKPLRPVVIDFDRALEEIQFGRRMILEDELVQVGAGGSGSSLASFSTLTVAASFGSSSNPASLSSSPQPSPVVSAPVALPISSSSSSSTSTLSAANVTTSSSSSSSSSQLVNGKTAAGSSSLEGSKTASIVAPAARVVVSSQPQEQRRKFVVRRGGSHVNDSDEEEGETESEGEEESEDGEDETDEDDAEDDDDDDDDRGKIRKNSVTKAPENAAGSKGAFPPVSTPANDDNGQAVFLGSIFGATFGKGDASSTTANDDDYDSSSDNGGSSSDLHQQNQKRRPSTFALNSVSPDKGSAGAGGAVRKGSIVLGSLVERTPSSASAAVNSEGLWSSGGVLGEMFKVHHDDGDEPSQPQTSRNRLASKEDGGGDDEWDRDSWQRRKSAVVAATRERSSSSSAVASSSHPTTSSSTLKASAMDTIVLDSKELCRRPPSIISPDARPVVVRCFPGIHPSWSGEVDDVLDTDVTIRIVETGGDAQPKDRRHDESYDQREVAVVLREIVETMMESIPTVTVKIQSGNTRCVRVSDVIAFLSRFFSPSSLHALASSDGTSTSPSSQQQQQPPPPLFLSSSEVIAQYVLSQLLALGVLHRSSSISDPAANVFNPLTKPKAGSTPQSILPPDIQPSTLLKFNLQLDYTEFFGVFLSWGGGSRAAVAIAEGMIRRLCACVAFAIENHYDVRNLPSYAAFQQSTADLQNVDLGRLSFNDAQTFFMNVYNCLCLHAHLTVALEEGTNFRNGHSVFMKGAQYRIGEVNYSLDDILDCLRGKAVKKFSPAGRISSQGVPDYRIHFALCDFTGSAPSLRIYTAENLALELDAAAEHFLQREVSVRVESGGPPCVMLPRVFKTFAKDFGGKNSQIIERISRFMDATSSRKLQDMARGQLKFTIKYSEYDWRLSIGRHMRDYRDALSAL